MSEFHCGPECFVRPAFEEVPGVSLDRPSQNAIPVGVLFMIIRTRPDLSMRQFALSYRWQIDRAKAKSRKMLWTRWGNKVV